MICSLCKHEEHSGQCSACKCFTLLSDGFQIRKLRPDDTISIRLAETGLRTIVGSDADGRVTLRLRYEQGGTAHTTEPFAVLDVGAALAFAQEIVDRCRLLQEAAEIEVPR